MIGGLWGGIEPPTRLWTYAIPWDINSLCEARSHVLALVCALFAASAAAHDFRAGDIVIDHPYALAGSGGVYFRTLRNEATLPEWLLGAGSPTLGRVALLHDGRQELLSLPAGAAVKMRHTGAWRLALGGWSCWT
jgi:hypothetical protein